MRDDNTIRNVALVMIGLYLGIFIYWAVEVTDQQDQSLQSLLKQYPHH